MAETPLLLPARGAVRDCWNLATPAAPLDDTQQRKAPRGHTTSAYAESTLATTSPWRQVLLLRREAVAQTFGQRQFLCIDDKSALPLQVISVAEGSL